ncbi:MAG: MBOAT family protein [Acidaminococcaceae bacterium]|nr:MBOAT family protein [Acidaminococcaceae bacterium]
MLSSYYFYMCWNVKYVLLIATATVVSYFCAIAIEETEKSFRKKLFLGAAVTVSLGILFVFKYFNFAMSTLSSLFSFNPVYLKFLLPVGISFYTFQSLSYVIDVYKGTQKAERNLAVYATFVSFFPQLVAGPIERTANLLPQIKKASSFDYNNGCQGILLIVWGMYKKVVIADNLAVWVDKVYGNVTAFHGFSLLVATIFFSLQIYCDFSGYTDIARGSAKLFNIDLMENFRCPYFSSGIKDFWNRWHISLSTWFRDYVYIPLGGNRCSKLRNYFNVIVTFLVSGLWHGADWTFVLWGGMHGAAQVLENILGIKKYNKGNGIWLVRVLLTFSFVVLAWVFFRAANIQDAVYVFKNMFIGALHFKIYFVTDGYKALGIKGNEIWKIFVLYLLPLIAYDYISLSNNIFTFFKRQSTSFRYASLFASIMLILLFGYFGQSSFVYFQF